MLLPLKKPRPDSRHFLDVLMGRTQAVPPLVEYLVDDVVMKPIVENMMGRTWVPAGSTGTRHEVRRSVPARESQKAYLDTFIEFWLRMGYDFVRLEIALGFQHRGIERSLAGGPHPLTLKHAETACGDTTIGHAWAYCQALEALAGVAVPPRSEQIRGVALELERLANHTGDLGALAGLGIDRDACADRFGALAHDAQAEVVCGDVLRFEADAIVFYNNVAIIFCR